MPLGIHFSLIELNGAMLKYKKSENRIDTYFSLTSDVPFLGLYEPGPTLMGVLLMGSIVPLAIICGSIVPLFVYTRLIAILKC